MRREPAPQAAVFHDAQQQLSLFSFYPCPIYTCLVSRYFKAGVLSYAAYMQQAALLSLPIDRIVHGHASLSKNCLCISMHRQFPLCHTRCAERYVALRPSGYISRLRGRPKLTAMAASTFSMTSLSTRPIRSRKRRLSSVRICSNRTTDSFGRP